jgi:hypothetical protein
MPPDHPSHAQYVGHTRGLRPWLSPSNILSHRKVPFQKAYYEAAGGGAEAATPAKLKSWASYKRKLGKTMGELGK